MKQKSLGLKALALLALVAAVGFSACKKEKKNPKTVVEVINREGYNVLSSLLGQAGLVSTLNGTGPFTVFAPANSAFDGITAPSGAALSNLLLYHVIAGQGLTAQQVISLSNGNLVKVTMANGDSTFVKGSSAGVFVNGIQVVRPDLKADNGVVHGINRVLFPATGNIVQTAQNTPGFDSLVKAVVRVSTGATGADNIAEVLSTVNGLTVFAPTNQGFAALFANAAFPFRQINDIPVDILRTVLRHHVVVGRVFSNDLRNGTVPMANGSNSTVAGVGTSNITIAGSGTVFNNGAQAIVATNVMATNGVIHAIGGVIIP